jgi:putative two-component system response regulator
VKILVADDDRVISLMVCGILRKQGHDAVAAFDAMQALMVAMKPPQPQLIILDLNMPGGTGIGALTKLKSSNKTAAIPVIVQTGTTDPKLRTEALALGAAEVLTKPVNPEVLLAAVAKATAQK